MHKSIVWAMLVGGMCAAGLAEAAEPLRGTGYFGGFSSNTAHVVSFNDQYTTGGFAFGIDWQLPVNESFTFNPFIRGDIGSVSGGVADGFDAEHLLAGADLRWWPVEGYFAGATMAFVDETLTQTAGAVAYKNSGSGMGGGITFGGEFDIGKSGNLIVQLQYFVAPGLAVFPDTDIDLSVVRLEIGYRAQGFDLSKQ